MSGPLKTESGNAERVRHEEIDLLELAEVIGTCFELGTQENNQRKHKKTTKQIRSINAAAGGP